MTRSIRTMLAAVFGLSLAAGPSPAVEVATAPGLRGEVIANMMDAGEKIIELAGAVPANKWSWRPGKGVRSVGEVYLHVVQGNYFLSSFLGANPPMPMAELQKLDTTPQPPEKAVQMLRDSYAFVAKVIAETPEEDLATKVDFFGHEVTKQAMMLNAAAHSHEHLGQSIAYARSNGVVPPWTAREQAAAKKAATGKAAGEQGGHEGHSH